MKDFMNRTVVIFIFIYLALISILTGFFYWYSNDFSIAHAKEVANQTHQVSYETLNNNLNRDYEKYIEYVNLYGTTTNLKQNMNQMSIGSLEYVDFYLVDDDGVFIDGNHVDFLDPIEFNTYYKLPMSFYKLNEVLVNSNDTALYGVFQHDNTIGLFNADKYLDGLISTTASNSLIMRQNGFILASNKPVGTKILNEYVDSTTTNFFNDYFSLEKSDTVWVQIQNETYAMSFAPLTETLPLYYLTFYPQSSLVLSFNALSLYMMMTLLVVGTFFILANFFIFYIAFLKFSDIENARLHLYMNKRFVIKMSSTGKIKNFNNSFKKMVKGYKKFKHVNDFQLILAVGTSTAIDILNNQESIYAQFDTLTGKALMKFIPLRMGFSYLLVGDNVTQKDNMLREYEQMALINPITKVPNYNSFIQYVDDLIKTDKLKKEIHTIVAINILDFKNINKLIGKTIANQGLVGIVKLIERQLEKIPHMLFNTYVDNFIIMFNHDKPVKEIQKWVDDLILYVNVTKNLGDIALNLELRAGIYEIILSVEDTVSSQIIYDRVMTALKYANHSPLSKSAIYDINLRKLVNHISELEKGLVQAIEKQEFTMHLQPQYDMSQNKILSFESLIRWTNPKYSHISPLEFIRVAEENDLILKIGKFVMEETMKIAKQLEAYNVVVAMNISPIQIIQQGFVQSFQDLLTQYDIKKNAVALEITETAMISSAQLLSEKLRLLQKVGINIHLDDFGMGYSSLSYLNRLPIDMIKIDKNFIDHIATDKYSKAIVSMIVALSKSIGVDVIAEGVETDIQKKALQKIGVNIIQGFIISKAVPIEEAIKLLEKYNYKK